LTNGIEVTVTNDLEATKTALEAFRTAYNKLNATLTDLTKIDPTGNNDGALQGDSTASGLQNMLKRMLGDSGPASSTYKRLSDVGLELQRDGSLTTNTSKLNTALENVSALKELISASGATSLDNGIGRRIRDFTRAAVGVNGVVAGRNTALQSAISRKSKDIEKVEDRVSQVEKRLLAQYSRLDANLGSINSLGTFVSQQIAQWNR
jgi:flagellar hook-associated protein 2